MDSITKFKKPQPLWEGIVLLAIKIIYFLFLIKNFNIFISILIFFFSIYIYHKIIYYLFNLTPLSGYDKVFLTTDPIGRYQIAAFSRYMHGFDPVKYRQFLIERLISKNAKCRSKIVKKFMEYYWYTEPDIEKAANSIIKCSPRLKDFNQVMEFIRSEVNNQIDIFHEFPYVLNMVPYGENEGVCIFKFDHLFTDGLGVIASLCLIADNFSEDTYPKILKMMKEPNIYQYVYLYLVSPFYCIYIFFNLLFEKERKCPFKANKKEVSKETIVAISKKFNLKDFEKFRKLNNVSFNDVMLASFSITINNIYKKTDEYKNIKNIYIDLPVGRKMLPTKFDQLKITNEASGLFFEIPLINNISDVTKIKKTIRSNFRPEIMFSLGLLADLLGNIFSWHFISKYSKDFNKRFDFMFTNVPGPAHKLTYYGMDLDELYTFNGAEGGLPTICILSYDGYFQFCVDANKNTDFDIQMLVDEFEKQVEKFIIK